MKHRNQTLRMKRARSCHCKLCPLFDITDTDGELRPRHLRTKFLSVDGNFKLINLLKNNNQHDRSLCNGRGYMQSNDLVLEHVEKHKSLPVEVTQSFSNLLGNVLKNSTERRLQGLLCHRELEPKALCQANKHGSSGSHL